jgi:hypothetical protein
MASAFWVPWWRCASWTVASSSASIRSMARCAPCAALFPFSVAVCARDKGIPILIVPAENVRKPPWWWMASAFTRVERVTICTPDKDLAQCVRGTRIVQLNRRTRVTLDEAGVVSKFGVTPGSIPDYLALVGDAANGYPGLPGVVRRRSRQVPPP